MVIAAIEIVVRGRERREGGRGGGEEGGEEKERRRRRWERWSMEEEEISLFQNFVLLSPVTTVSFWPRSNSVRTHHGLVAKPT